MNEPLDDQAADAVSDRAVAALRALLLRDMREHHRLLDLLDDEEARLGYFPLVTTAFFVAVERRFAGRTRSEIVDWIARARSARGTQNPIDPDVAEKLVSWVFGATNLDDLDAHVGMRHQTMLLILLVEEQRYDEQGLEAFLAQARVYAEQVAA